MDAKRLLGCVLALAAAISVWPGSAEGEIVAKRLKTIGDVTGIVEDSMTVSPDGARLAVVVESGASKTRRVIVDGQHVGGIYDEIGRGVPIFSWDSKRVAFVARRKKQCFVVIDGKVSDAYAIEDNTKNRWPVAALVFSPDSKHVAYQVHQNSGVTLVVDGKSYGPYDDVAVSGGKRVWGLWEFMFSPDSKSFAFRAQKGGNMLACAGTLAPSRHWKQQFITAGPFDAVGRGTPVWTSPARGISSGFAFIVRQDGAENILILPALGGKTGSGYDAIVRNSVVSLGGGNLSYVVRKNSKSVAMLQGREGKAYDDLSSLIINGGRTAYAAAVGNEVCMVIDGKEGPRYEGVRYPGTVFGPQVKRVAYAVSKAGKSAVWIDSRESKWYDRVDYKSLTFSPDGAKFAFAANSKTGAKVVLDSVEGPSFSEVSHLSFNADGGRFAYAGRLDFKHWLVLDGKKLGPYDDVRGHSFTFSPDGKHYACVVIRRGNCHVLSDGVLGPQCDRVMSRLVFNAKGDRLAYVVRRVHEGRLNYAVVYNREMGQDFDAVWIPDGGNLMMDDKGTVRFLAIKNKLVQLWSVGPGNQAARQQEVANSTDSRHASRFSPFSSSPSCSCP
jgi:WD40 repeat protein